MAVTPQALLTMLGIDYIERPNRLGFCCPFHHDTDPSAGFYLNTELAHCFSCGYTYDPYRFYQEFKKVNEDVAIRDLEKEFGERKERKQVDKVRLKKFRALVESRLSDARDIGMRRHALMGEEADRLIDRFEKGQDTAEEVDKNLEIWYNRVLEAKNDPGFDPATAPRIGADDRIEEGMGDISRAAGAGGEICLGTPEPEDAGAALP